MPNKFAGRAVADRADQMQANACAVWGRNDPTMARDASRWEPSAHFSRLLARLLAILSTSEAEVDTEMEAETAANPTPPSGRGIK